MSEAIDEQKESAMSRIELGGMLTQISKYGFGTLLSIWLIWQIVIPLKDAAVDSMNRTATASEENAATAKQTQKVIQEFSANSERQSAILLRIEDRLETQSRTLIKIEEHQKPGGS